MVKLLSEASVCIERALERYIRIIFDNPIKDIVYTFIINMNWNDTRTILCNYRKDEIEKSNNETTIHTPIIILSILEVNFDPGIQNLYHFVNFGNLKSINSLNIQPIEINTRYAKILWREHCSDYIRKIIHDLRGKDSKIRESEINRLEKILSKSDIEKIKEELK